MDPGLGFFASNMGVQRRGKKIVIGLKGHVGKIAHDGFGCMLLVCILSNVDDTKLITKVIIRKLQAVLKEIIMDKNGRRPLLQLLHPNCPRYFSPDDLASLDSSIPSLCNKVEINSELDKQTKALEVEVDEENKSDTEEITANRCPSGSETLHLSEGGKKHPFLRRQELLVNSGLAECLIDACSVNWLENYLYQVLEKRPYTR